VWWCCCPGGVVVVVLSWGRGRGCVVVVVLSWWCCRGGVVVVVLSWWCCRGRVVVTTPRQKNRQHNTMNKYLSPQHHDPKNRQHNTMTKNCHHNTTTPKNGAHNTTTKNCLHSTTTKKTAPEKFLKSGYGVVSILNVMLQRIYVVSLNSFVVRCWTMLNIYFYLADVASEKRRLLPFLPCCSEIALRNLGDTANVALSSFQQSSDTLHLFVSIQVQCH